LQRLCSQVLVRTASGACTPSRINDPSRRTGLDAALTHSLAAVQVVTEEGKQNVILKLNQITSPGDKNFKGHFIRL